MAEAQRLVDAVPVRYRAMVLLAAWAGLRYGELAALTRGDIDLRTGTVSVNETVTTLQSGERFPGPPKSEAGRRSVAIPSTILPAISAHLETVATEPTRTALPCARGRLPATPQFPAPRLVTGLGGNRVVLPVPRPQALRPHAGGNQRCCGNCIIRHGPRSRSYKGFRFLGRGCSWLRLQRDIPAQADHPPPDAHQLQHCVI